MTVIPSADVIKEVIQPLITKPEEEETPQEESITEPSEETKNEILEEEIEATDSQLNSDDSLVDAEKLINNSSITEELSDILPDLEKESPAIPTPPQIPIIQQPSSQDLQSLLTPIQQPKIPLATPINDAIPISEKLEVPEPQSSESQISVADLLDEPTAISSEIKTAPEPVTLGKTDAELSANEKEAKILAAMEEVAALMPPGPAKKFVEEMMLKRTDQDTLNSPRMPKQFNSDN